MSLFRTDIDKTSYTCTMITQLSRRTKGIRTISVIVLLSVYCTILRSQTIDTAKIRISAIQKLDSAEIFRKTHRVADGLTYTLEAIELIESYPKEISLHEEIHKTAKEVFNDLGSKRQAARHAVIQRNFRQRRLGHCDLVCAKLLGAAGSWYMAIGEKDSTFKFYREAMHALEESEHHIFYASAFNNLALAERRFNDKDSAILYFQKCLSIIDSLAPGKDVRFEKIVEINIANTYEMMGYERKAINIYWNAVNDNSGKSISRGHKLDLWLKIASYSRLQSADTFARSIKAVKDLLLTIPSEHLDPIRKADYHALLFLEALNQDEDKIASRNVSKMVAILDSLMGNEMAQKANAIDAMNDYRLKYAKQTKKLNETQLYRKDQELALKEKDSEFNMFVLISGLVATLVLAIIIFLTLRKRSNQLVLARRLTMLELENQKLEQEKLTAELRNKKNDLTQLALDNSRKREWERELVGKLKGVRKSKSEDIDRLIRQLELDMNTQLQVDDKMEIFHDNVDKVNQEFYNSLTAKHPELTSGERELCGMLKLKLSGKEIANIRNVNPKSISKAKQRLRKKLELGLNADLYDYMEKIQG